MINSKYDYYVIDSMWRDGEYLTYSYYHDGRERTSCLNWDYYGPFNSLLEKFDSGSLILYCPELVQFYCMERYK